MDRPDRYVERLRDEAGVHARAWEQTREDMAAVAETRREDGWEVLEIPAPHVNAVSPDMGEEDQFGLVYVVPDNYADDLLGIVDRCSVSAYQVYGTDVEGFVYLVTELLDPERETAVMLAGRYDTLLATGMAEAARERDVIYTHAETIDGTTLATVRHEEYEPFLGEATAGE